MHPPILALGDDIQPVDTVVDSNQSAITGEVVIVDRAVLVGVGFDR